MLYQLSYASPIASHFSWIAKAHESCAAPRPRTPRLAYWPMARNCAFSPQKGRAFVLCCRSFGGQNLRFIDLWRLGEQFFRPGEKRLGDFSGQVRVAAIFIGKRVENSIL